MNKRAVIEILKEALFQAWKIGYEQRRDDKFGKVNHSSEIKAAALYDRIVRDFPEEAMIAIVSDAYCRGFNHAQNDHVRPDEDVAEPELIDLTADLKHLWEGTEKGETHE